MINQIIPQNLFSNNTTSDTYFLKLFYKNYVLQKEYYPYQFDGLEDKKHYGRFDNSGNIIYPKESYLKPYTNNLGVTHKNLPFVVDAFKDFKIYQNELLKTNRSNNNSIYVRMNVLQSTDNVPDLYLKHLNNLYTVFSNDLLNPVLSNNIESIKQFSFYFIKFLTIITKAVATNRSAFINTRLVPESINGLRISLDNPPANADIKLLAQKYIGDTEFDRFIDSAAKFGFFVDRNSPWTLVCDLESPVTRKYAENYNLFSTDQILETCYHKAYTADLESLRNVMLSFWNSFAAKQSSVTKSLEIPNCKNAFTEHTILNQLDIRTFEKHFDVNWQIRLYLFSRILEEKLKITQNKFELLYLDALNINNLHNTEKALEYVNIKMRELSLKNKVSTNNLTTPDAVVKLLSGQIADLPTEGINF